MSQTETLLLVVLGFALASLVALFIGRFTWHLALRIGARRMQRQVPATVKDLQTERDRLRADYALLSQKLSARLDTVKARMAEQMAEVSRTRNRIESLTIDLNTRDATIAGRDMEIVSLKDRIAALEAGLAEATDNVTARTAEISRLQTEAEDRGNRIAALEAGLAEASDNVTARTVEISRLQSEIEDRGTRMAALEAGIAAADIAMPPAVEGGAGSDGLQHSIENLTQLSQQIAESRNRPETAQNGATSAAELDRKLVQAEQETAELQKELARLDEAWAGKLLDPDKKPAPGETKSAAVANVVKLAQRIRTLN